MPGPILELVSFEKAESRRRMTGLEDCGRAAAGKMRVEYPAARDIGTGILSSRVRLKTGTKER